MVGEMGCCIHTRTLPLLFASYPPSSRSLSIYYTTNQQRAGKQLDAIASQIRLLGAPPRATDGPLSPDRARERTTHLAELRKTYVHQRTPTYINSYMTYYRVKPPKID